MVLQPDLLKVWMGSKSLLLRLGIFYQITVHFENSETMDYQAEPTGDELSGNFPSDNYDYEILMSLKEETIKQRDYITAVTFLLILISVSISFLLVFYIVFKSRSLRTRTNFIILNFFILAEIFALVAAVDASIEAFSFHDSRSYSILLVIEISLFNVLISLALLLAFDWYSSATWHRAFSKYAKYYKFIVGLLHFPLLFPLCSFVVHHHYFYLVNCAVLFSSGITYITSFISVLTWNIKKVRETYTKESLKTYYAFSCATFYIFIWLPIFLVVTIKILFPHPFKFYDANERYVQIMYWIIHTLVSATILSPVMITYLLTRWDEQVKMAFGQMFKRKNAQNLDLDGYVHYKNHYNEGLEIEENLSV